MQNYTCSRSCTVNRQNIEGGCTIDIRVVISRKLNSACAGSESAGIIPVAVNGMSEGPGNKSGAAGNGDVVIYRYARNGGLTVSVGQDKVVISYAIDILVAGAVEIHGVRRR